MHLYLSLSNLTDREDDSKSCRDVWARRRESQGCRIGKDGMMCVGIIIFEQI